MRFRLQTRAAWPHLPSVARELHLQYAHYIEAAWRTANIDIALEVIDWPTIKRLWDSLIEAKLNVPREGVAQRLTFRCSPRSNNHLRCGRCDIHIA